jgi:hypothetical protein
MNWTKRPRPRCQGSESCSLEHIYAALAEKERAMISVRTTKEALAREGQRRAARQSAPRRGARQRRRELEGRLQQKQPIELLFPSSEFRARLHLE